MPQLRKHPSGPPTADIQPHGGIGRTGSTLAARVSDDLRRHASPALTSRRTATALTLVAAAALGVVDAYQTGLLRRVPEPRMPGLGADRVDAAAEAYRLFGTPDAGVGIASYGLTLVLIGAGPEDRWRQQPWLPLLAAAKVLADAAGGLYLFAEQVTKHRRVCSWCTVASAASVAAVPAVLVEARQALRNLRSRAAP